jgi:sulfite exporter TauE/SafE
MLQRVAVGAAWGLVPCTLVYGMLPLALFAGGAWQGAAVMLAFGVATLPNLVGIGWLVQRFRHALRGSALRAVAAGLLGAFALAGLYRVAFIPEALGQGPFCIVP